VSLGSKALVVSKEHSIVAKKNVKVVLNQQQLELIDKTVARGIAQDRESLLKMALKEFAAKHQSSDSAATSKPRSVNRHGKP
jgi:hypothetical protein